MRAPWRLIFIFAVIGHCEESATSILDGSELPEETVTEDGEYDQEVYDEVPEPPREQEPLSPRQMVVLHAKIDTDKDGLVTLIELMDFSKVMRMAAAKRDLPAAITDLDTDQDQKLTLVELFGDLEKWEDPESQDKKEAEKRKNLEEAKFKKADADSDGKLDLEELPSLFFPDLHDGMQELTSAQTLTDKDTDGNGELSPQEFFGAATNQGAMPAPEEDAEFKKLDEDGNGALSIKEIKKWESGEFHSEEAFKSMFDVADKDKNAKLSPEELAQNTERIAQTPAQYHLKEWIDHHSQEL